MNSSQSDVAAEVARGERSREGLSEQQHQAAPTAQG